MEYMGASDLLPAASIILQVSMVLRLVLFISAFFFRDLTRTVFYLEIAVQITEALLPIDVASAFFYLSARMMLGIAIFSATYYNFWPDFIVSLFAIIPFYFTRYSFQDDDFGSLTTIFPVLLFLQALILLMVHILISKLAFLIAGIKI